eukprot:1143046-Pelagomonas_calceolata.AAC.2
MFNVACVILHAQAQLSWSALAACPFFTAPPVFCSAAPAAATSGGGYCWCLNVRHLRPGVAIAPSNPVPSNKIIPLECKAHPRHTRLCGNSAITTI